MAFVHMHNDVQSERLLLVVLENSDRYSSEYRHIRATVVRRAVPHAVNSDGVVDWADDHSAQCSGYRVASWVLSKTSGLYVDDMQYAGKLTPTQCTHHLTKAGPTEIR